MRLKSKAWYRSKGTWGTIVAGIAGGIGGYANYVDPSYNTPGLHVVTFVIGTVALLISFIGRYDAYRPIHIFWPYYTEIHGDD